jgi:ribosomal protein L10
MDYVIGNTGFIFTNADLSSVRDVVVANKVPAPARVGSIAPVDVWVEPGPTGCDPGQTSWFQALNIPTKVRVACVPTSMPWQCAAVSPSAHRLLLSFFALCCLVFATDQQGSD